MHATELKQPMTAEAILKVADELVDDSYHNFLVFCAKRLFEQNMGGYRYVGSWQNSSLWGAISGETVMVYGDGRVSMDRPKKPLAMEDIHHDYRSEMHEDILAAQELLTKVRNTLTRVGAHDNYSAMAFEILTRVNELEYAIDRPTHGELNRSVRSDLGRR